MSAPSITLVLADDHPIVLDGLQQLFSSEPDFAILARCPDGEAALEAVRRLRPDVLVVDLQMPGKNGLAVLRELQAEAHPTRAVVLTASFGDDEVLQAVRLGARGVVLKDMAPHLLVQCVRAVHAGGEWLEQGVLARALDRFLQRDEVQRGAARLYSPRELEVVRLVAQGLRNKEIARKLDITEGTVKIHLYNVYRKAGVHSRIALMRYAQESFLV